MKLFKSVVLILFSYSLSANNLLEIDLYELYKDLHRNPELSYKEFQTSKKLSLILNDIGYEITNAVGGNGVVALLKNGKGKTVMLRADMDGLPVQEKTGASYASKTKTVKISSLPKIIVVDKIHLTLSSNKK